MENVVVIINNYEELKCVLENIEEYYKEVRWIVGIKPTEFKFDINEDVGGEPVCLIINSDKKIMWGRNNILDNEDNEENEDISALLSQSLFDNNQEFGSSIQHLLPQGDGQDDDDETPSLKRPQKWDDENHKIQRCDENHDSPV